MATSSKNPICALVGVESGIDVLLARRFKIAGDDLARALVGGRIMHGINLGPNRLPGECWHLHCQERVDWERELVLR